MNAAEYNTTRSKLQSAIRFHEQRVSVLQGRLLVLREAFKSELRYRLSPVARMSQLQLEDRK